MIILLEVGSEVPRESRAMADANEDDDAHSDRMYTPGEHVLCRLPAFCLPDASFLFEPHRRTGARTNLFLKMLTRTEQDSC